MKNIKTHTKSSKNLSIVTILLIALIFSSCEKQEEVISQESDNEKNIESISEINEDVTEVNEDEKGEDSYKYRDQILGLLDDDKIFNIAVNEEVEKEEIIYMIKLENDPVELKDLDKIRIGLSVEKATEEVYTNIYSFQTDKNYWEIDLSDGKLKEEYYLDLDEQTNLLTDEEIQILKEDDRPIIIRFDIFVDKGSPISIYNHFLNKK